MAEIPDFTTKLHLAPEAILAITQNAHTDHGRFLGWRLSLQDDGQTGIGNGVEAAPNALAWLTTEGMQYMGAVMSVLWEPDLEEHDTPEPNVLGVTHVLDKSFAFRAVVRHYVDRTRRTTGADLRACLLRGERLSPDYAAAVDSPDEGVAFGISRPSVHDVLSANARRAGLPSPLVAKVHADIYGAEHLIQAARYFAGLRLEHMATGLVLDTSQTKEMKAIVEGFNGGIHHEATRVDELNATLARYILGVYGHFLATKALYGEQQQSGRLITPEDLGTELDVAETNLASHLDEILIGLGHGPYSSHEKSALLLGLPPAGEESPSTLATEVTESATDAFAATVKQLETLTAPYRPRNAEIRDNPLVAVLVRDEAQGVSKDVAKRLVGVIHTIAGRLARDEDFSPTTLAVELLQEADLHSMAHTLKTSLPLKERQTVPPLPHSLGDDIRAVLKRRQCLEDACVDTMSLTRMVDTALECMDAAVAIIDKDESSVGVMTSSRKL